MILDRIRDSASSSNIVWQKHSLQRMFERDISRYEVKEAILKGIIIEDYSDDYPFPSVLVAFVVNSKPLHVVVSYDIDSLKCYIITAYMPDTKHFKDDLVTRRENEEE
jgi:hypothetical protein